MIARIKRTDYKTVNKRVKVMKNTNVVAYYRVSTQRQGVSGLGLEAQRQTVHSFCESKKAVIIAEFTEIESGKKNNRPQLLEAIKLCKEKDATLVIAKLDRLARNYSFVMQLQDSGLDFVACDLPEANKFTIQIMAAFAQHERELISNRVTKSLAIAKQKGVVLGNPMFKDSEKMKKYRSMAVPAKKKKARENENNVRATAIIEQMRKNGESWANITRKLNESKYRTSKDKDNGKGFQIIQVQRLAKAANIQ